MSNTPNPQLLQQIITAANQLSPDEAARRYQQIMAQLPPDVATQLNALVVSRLPSDARRQVAAQLRRANDDPSRPFSGFSYADEDEAAQPQALGRMLKLARDQDPQLAQGLLENDSGLGGQLGKMALAALAYILIQRMMGDQANERGAGQSGGGGLGGLLGGLLGSLLGGLTGASQSGRGQASGADPIGSILGDLLGGGQMSQADVDRMGRTIGEVLGSGQGRTGGSFGGAGDPLGGLLGGGGSSQQAPDLGGLLGALLGSIGSQGEGGFGLRQADSDDEGSGLKVRGSQKG